MTVLRWKNDEEEFFEVTVCNQVFVDINSGHIDPDGNHIKDGHFVIDVPESLFNILLESEEFKDKVKTVASDYRDKVTSEINSHGYENVFSCGNGYEIRKTPVERCRDVKSGYVYLLKISGHDSVKIGMTCNRNINTRIEQIQNASPHDVEVVGYVKVDDAFGVETKLHDKFRKQRVRREWFEVDLDQAIREYSKFGVFVAA